MLTMPIVRVETVIREDFMMEGLELLQLHVDTLLARFNLLALPDLDPGVQESVVAVIYSAQRVDIKELSAVRDVLGAKHGKEFVRQCVENMGGCVNPRVLILVLL